MDLQERYWDNNERQVRTRKFVSKFLNRPNATNLHSALSASLTNLSEKQLLQISMDGPNVNWGVLGLTLEERFKQEFPDIINIGSCGLHNVHRAFDSDMEVSELSLGKVLKEAWLLSHDSSARRDRFILICFCFIQYVSERNDLLSMVIAGYFNFDFRPLYLFWDFINCLIN